VDDSVDLHLARWHGKAPFDQQVEGIVTRMQALLKHLHRAKVGALAEIGLQDFEFETLHRLVGRGGSATPSELAADLLLSPAGMTGRLDTLEKAGFVHRVRSTDDRRRVDVEITGRGEELWLEAIKIGLEVETGMVHALAPEERDVLDGLLKRLLLNVEANQG
jgi:DNA-binding MarR family transcriptional regulator